jgi:hypothetical protein
MATAQDIVTSAFRALHAIDINEQPSPNEAQVGLDTLSAMIAFWSTKKLNVADQTLTGTTTLGSADVSGLDVSVLAPGLNVAGTGIPAGTRIKSISGSTVTLTAAATASGTVALIFTALPFEAKHELGVIALLAMQVAPLVGIDAIPAMVVRNADLGWSALRGQFLRRSKSKFDLPRDDHLVKSDGTQTG